MDLTGKEDLDWRGRGYIEADGADGSEVVLTGDLGDLTDDVDDVLADLLADHDVGRYPDGALIGFFPPSDLSRVDLRDPAEIEADPYPFETD